MSDFTWKPIQTIGSYLALYMAYKLWGNLGVWFTLGLLLSNGNLLSIELLFGRKQ